MGFKFWGGVQGWRRLKLKLLLGADTCKGRSDALTIINPAGLCAPARARLSNLPTRNGVIQKDQQVWYGNSIIGLSSPWGNSAF